MKKFFSYFLSLVLISSLFLSLASAVLAGDSKFLSGLKATAETGAGYPAMPKPLESLTKVLGSAFTVMFLGISFLGLMIYAGITWMLARGNEQEVEKAKNIIIYAVIGLAVVVGAYVITKLVIPLWVYIITRGE